jgi:molecular chaperone GrpE
MNDATNGDAGQVTEDGPDAGAAESVDAMARIPELEAERDQIKDRLLRTLAEMENLRRRTEKEAQDARAYAVTAFARDMIGVVDNLGRAIASVPPEQRPDEDGPFKALIEGIELTERDLLKSLERHGVTRIHPQGERFDPNRHQAIFEAPDAATPKGNVSSVAQTGFAIHDRILRPALVGVSSGAPRAPGDTLDRTV